MRVLTVFILGLFMVLPQVSAAGENGDMPASLAKSLQKAAATQDPFIIDATFNRALAEHPAHKDEIMALMPRQAAEVPVVPAAHAPQPVASTKEPALPEPDIDWTGELAAAFDRETGNTQTESVILSYDVARESEDWRHQSDGRVRYKTEDDQTINEDYRLRLSTDWKFDDRMFLFGEAEYVKDEFSGFDYRITESIGLGSRWKWDEDASFFDLRASVGGRHLNSTTPGADVEHTAVFKPAAELHWHISDRVNLNQKAGSTIGSDVTITETETSLNYALNHKLALKLSFQLEHTSSVPAGTEKLETYTSTGISYKLFQD